MTALEILALVTAGYTRKEIEAMEQPAPAAEQAPEPAAEQAPEPAAEQAPAAEPNPEIAALTAQVTKLTELLQDQNRRAGVPRPQEDDPLLKMIRR